MTSLSPSKRTRIPVSTGRDSSREAERPTRADRVEERLAVDGERAVGLDLRQPRKVLGAVRVQRIGRRAARQASDALVSAMLEGDLAGGKQANDVDEQASRNDDGALLLDLRLQGVAHGDLHVGCAQMQRPPAARSMMPARICTVVRVETPRPTTWSFSASSSFPQTTRMVVAATVSMDAI